MRLLEAYGVRHVFGIPGLHTIELYRGMSGSLLEHVLPRHEQGAGFMADGYARASGRPGVCFLITGPGVTNALTAVGQAYSDSVPMLVISSVAARADLGRQRGRLHETRDQRSILAPVTAFSATALLSSDLPDYVARAFAIFGSGRPRPVHIEVPLDVLASPPVGDWSVYPTGARPGPRPADATRAAALLLAAERPALICGGGAWGARAQVVELVDRLALPMFCTIAGKGLLPGDHPLSLGATLSRAEARDYVAGCDVVVAVGTELAESELLTSEPLPIAGELIRVDIDPVQLLDEHRSTLPILSDAAAALDAILESVRRQPPARRALLARRRSQATQVNAAIAAGLSADELSHGVVLDTMRAVLSPATRIFADMTTIAYTGNVTYPVPQGGRWIHPAGYGSLGFALPAAAGAAIAADGEGPPVVALIGDGGFQFTLPELGAVAERRLPVIVVLWNSEGYAKIREGMEAQDIRPVGVDYTCPRFDRLAEAYGVTASRPRSVESFGQALSAAVARRGPALIELTPATVCGARS